MNGEIERIKVCLNGGRGRAEHPGVPITAPELARSAAEAVAAGAEAVHLHPRGADGAESLAAGDVGAAVAAVRRACPGTPVGVSTGLWISGGNVAVRRAAMAGWADLPAAARPDFASVNAHESGMADVLEMLGRAGVAAEAGVWSAAAAREVVAAGPGAGWLRILVEVVGIPAAEAVAVAEDILGQLDPATVTAPILLHGEGAACWPLVRHSARLGLPTRIGFEDTTTGPDGQTVASNAELVRLALAAWTAARLPA